MPPAVSSESDFESEVESDNASVVTSDNAPDSAPEEGFGRQETHAPKRKAESETAGHVAKTPRTDSRASKPENTPGDDEDMPIYGNYDDHGGYVEQSFSVPEEPVVKESAPAALPVDRFELPGPVSESISRLAS